MKRLMLCAAAAAVLAACSSMPTGEAATVAQAAMEQPAPAAMEFVRMAGASDLYEIQSSQVVMETTQNADLRAFAQMMIDHHTQTTATVTAAARAAGMTPPAPMLDTAKSQMIRELQAAQGMDRDMLYIRQQVMAHREALTLHTSYSNTGDTTQLKAAAATAVPIVARHYNAIVAMQEGGMDHDM
jgi:putative membrane protein